MGLPRFVLLPEWGRFTLFAGRLCVHERKENNSSTASMPIWAKPVSIFGLLTVTTFRQVFASANHSTRS
jgi:hypothetical protein